MAKKKAELQSDAHMYRVTTAKMHEANSQGSYFQALDLAASAWQYVDGMMQFERRFEGISDRYSLECIDYVLRYAPLLFATQILQKLADNLDAQRRIEKNTAANISEKFDAAMALMWDAHRLWSCLEQAPIRQEEFNNAPSPCAENWRAIVNVWEEMRIVQWVNYDGTVRLQFVTSLTEEVHGKCPNCAGTTFAPKLSMLEPMTCSHCREEVDLVFLRGSDR